MFFKRSDYRMPVIHSNASDAKKMQDELPGFCISGCAISDAGCVRSQNEDNFLLLDQISEKNDNCFKTLVKEQSAEKNWLLAGVFDGISSTKQADLASREVADAFCKAGCKLQNDVSDEQAEWLLRSTFWDVNEKIVKTRQGGTTATVLCMNRKVFKIFQLGDSRAYLFRNGELHQLTRDQTLAQLKMDAGLYNTFCPEFHKENHILTDYVGRDGGGYPAESNWIPVSYGDQVLLCSDGLYEMCSENQMTLILREAVSTEEKAEKMVTVAKKNGGIDNITCLILRFQNREEV